jgi:hypothetical protein
LEIDEEAEMEHFKHHQDLMMKIKREPGAAAGAASDRAGSQTATPIKVKQEPGIKREPGAGADSQTTTPMNLVKQEPGMTDLKLGGPPGVTINLVESDDDEAELPKSWMVDSEPQRQAEIRPLGPGRGPSPEPQARSPSPRPDTSQPQRPAAGFDRPSPDTSEPQPAQAQASGLDLYSFKMNYEAAAAAIAANAAAPRTSVGMPVNSRDALQIMALKTAQQNARVMEIKKLMSELEEVEQCNIDSGAAPNAELLQSLAKDIIAVASKVSGEAAATGSPEDSEFFESTQKVQEAASILVKDVKSLIGVEPGTGETNGAAAESDMMEEDEDFRRAIPVLQKTLSLRENDHATDEDGAEDIDFETMISGLGKVGGGATVKEVILDRNTRMDQRTDNQVQITASFRLTQANAVCDRCTGPEGMSSEVIMICVSELYTEGRKKANLEFNWKMRWNPKHKTFDMRVNSCKQVEVVAADLTKLASTLGKKARLDFGQNAGRMPDGKVVSPCLAETTDRFADVRYIGASDGEHKVEFPENLYGNAAVELCRDQDGNECCTIVGEIDCLDSYITSAPDWRLKGGSKVYDSVDGTLVSLRGVKMQHMQRILFILREYLGMKHIWSSTIPFLMKTHPTTKKGEGLPSMFDMYNV